MISSVYIKFLCIFGEGGEGDFTISGGPANKNLDEILRVMCSFFEFSNIFFL